MLQALQTVGLATQQGEDARNVFSYLAKGKISLV